MARFIAASPRAATPLAVLLSVGLILAALVAVGRPTPAAAAPSDQGVRIEGRTATLYEGVLRTDGHAVATPSDGDTPRRCDGTNNGANPTPGPTPTAAADDAMRSVGMGWDGYWTPGLEDYFVQRFGPDREDPDRYAHWGLVVNGIYASLGGCQYRLAAGDQTLWVYDAFNRHDLLRLDGPHGIGEPTADVERGPSAGPVQRSFTVGLGQPLTVTAVKNQATGDIGAAGYRLPAPGVRIAPVATASNGVQTIVEADPATAVTGHDGRATLSWTTPGWKRIKATAAGFVRSNRLDVCVTEADGSGCGALPADATPRPAPPSAVPQPKVAAGGGNSLAVTGSPKAPASFSVGGLRIRGLRVTADGNAAGLVGIRWEARGGATTAWRVDYRVPTERKPRWRRATSGTVEQSALLDLPVGRAVDLRIRLTPPRGSSVTKALGRVVVPVDDRVRKVVATGSRKRATDPLAWRRTVTVLRRGAVVRATLPAGRPAVVVRSHARRAVIEIRSRAAGRSEKRGRSGAAERWQRLTIKGRKDGRTAVVRAKRRETSSRIEVRVVTGVVRLDGLAAVP